MMKLFFYTSLVLCLFSSAAAFAQEIKGAIIDSSDSKPIPYCTIGLKYGNKENKESKVVADSLGRFDHVLADKGEVRLTISAVGYKVKELVFSVIESKNLGTIKLDKRELILEQVNVSAPKLLVSQLPDRLIYDVHNDPGNKSLSTLDMMRKVPLLSVGGDDQLKIKGQSNYRILINGKPSAIVDNKAVDYFKGLPSSDVSKIEVITIPPANYESEGLVGIINITMQKKILDGYDGSVSINDNVFSDQTSFSGSGFFDVKAGKVSLTGSIGAGVDKPKQDIDISRNSLSSNLNSLRQTNLDRFRSLYRYGSFDLNYQLSNLDLFTIQFSLFNGDNKIAGNDATTITSNNLLIEGFNSNKQSKENYHNVSYAVNYERSFKDSKEKFLTFSYQYRNYPDVLSDNVTFYNQGNYSQPDFVQYNDQKALEHTAQVDYTFPVKKVKVEVGSKAIFRVNKSNYQDISASVNVLESTFYNTQNVYSLYNTYSFDFAGLSFKAGARLEKTAIYATGSSNNQPVNFGSWNLSPSLAVQKKLKNSGSLNFGYSQRLSRPSINDLNTFIDRSNPFIQKTGNFTLQPSVGHNLQFSYSKYGNSDFMIGVNYSIQNNVIQQVVTYDASSNISSFKYENLAHDKSLGGNLYYKTSLAKNLTLDFNCNANEVWISGSVDNSFIYKNGLNLYASTSPTLNLKNGYRILGYLSYEKPRITLQQVANHNISSYLGVSKNFFKNNLNASVFAYNPFQRYRTIIRDLSGNNFQQSTDIQLYYRKFNAKITYNFGKSVKMRDVNKRINNDDVQQ